MATNAELKKLIVDLAKISKQVKSDLRKGMRRIATPTLEKVKGAASWSTRIPSSTRLVTGFTVRSAGIRITTDKNRSPHARPYEHGGKQGYFNHPVFADSKEPRNTWTWVRQRARPYMWPVAVEDIDNIGDRMLDLMIEIADENGFHKK